MMDANDRLVRRAYQVGFAQAGVATAIDRLRTSDRDGAMAMLLKVQRELADLIPENAR